MLQSPGVIPPFTYDSGKSGVQAFSGEIALRALYKLSLSFGHPKWTKQSICL